MSAWPDRLHLARKGWVTDIRLSRMGIASAPQSHQSFGFWAKRPDWHGRWGEVCLHDHVTVNLEDPEAALRSMAQASASVREACDRAWETYRDAVPCPRMDRDPDGGIGLTVSTYHTKHWEGCTLRPSPVEKIPDGLEALSPDVGEPQLRAVLDLVAAGLHVEDRLDPWFGPSRFVHDTSPRDWGYRTRLARKQQGETRVVFRPTETTTRLLDEMSVTGLLLTSGQALTDLFARCLPALPPGFEEFRPKPLEHVMDLD